MVSKNNKQLIAKRLTNREVPHYSLRKLGIGVVSVLLGTTMYMGANSTVANADAANTNSGQDGANTPAATETQQSPVAGSEVALQSNTGAVNVSGQQSDDVAAQVTSINQNVNSNALANPTNATPTTQSGNENQSNTSTNQGQNSQSVILQNNNSGQSQQQDPIANVGSVELYSYNETTQYNGSSIVKIPYTYNDAERKYNVIDLNDYSSQILNDENWNKSGNSIIYRDIYNHVITSFDPNSLADKSAITPVFVDIKENNISQNLSNLQLDLDNHPLRLTNGAWAEEFKSGSNTFLLTDGPASVNNPMEIIQTQRENPDSYITTNYGSFEDKTYPEEYYAFVNSKDYYKAFTNLGTISLLKDESVKKFV